MKSATPGYPFCVPPQEGPFLWNEERPLYLVLRRGFSLFSDLSIILALNCRALPLGGRFARDVPVSLTRYQSVATEAAPDATSKMVCYYWVFFQHGYGLKRRSLRAS